MQQDPDYESYSLDELYDARDHIDPVRFPLRLKRLDEEIARRKAAIEAKRPPREVRRPYAGSRAAAFLCDYLAIGLGWTIVDNLVTATVSSAVMELLSLGAFVAYFVATEGLMGASPGKRVFSLELEHRFDSRIMAALLRSLMVAAVSWVDWALLFQVPGVELLPMWVLHLLQALSWGLLAYACFQLLGVVPDGRLLHDRATATRVVPANQPMPERPARRPITGVAALLASIVVGLLPVTISHGIFGLIGGDSGRALIMSVKAQRAPSDSIETILAGQLRLRSRVAHSVTRTWSLNRGPRTTVQISIWVPFRSWNDETRRAVLDTIAPRLQFEGGYDALVITVRTGGNLDLSTASTYTLNDG